MSYDIRFAVKGEPDGRFYTVFEPELNSPTYNIGTIFRKSMDWDFEQGEWYRVKDIIPNIERGIHELSFNKKEYEQYEPENGWGTCYSALRCLQSILQSLTEHVEMSFDWNTYDIDYIWISW